MIHGLLHLLGYDHERGNEDARAMYEQERRLADVVVGAGLPCAPVPLTHAPPADDEGEPS